MLPAPRVPSLTGWAASLSLNTRSDAAYPGSHIYCNSTVLAQNHSLQFWWSCSRCAESQWMVYVIYCLSTYSTHQHVGHWYTALHQTPITLSLTGAWSYHAHGCRHIYYHDAHDTPTRSANFLKAMTTYLNELVDIHPHVHHLPNHHVSMHLPQFFHLFGPSQAFWCLPFKCLIGKIQWSLSNHKLGVSLGVPTLTLIVLKQFS